MSSRHPQPGTVFLETNWRFVKAVRIGETITATVEVEHVRSDKPICKLVTTVRNAAGEDCVLGTATRLSAAASKADALLEGSGSLLGGRALGPGSAEGVADSVERRLDPLDRGEVVALHRPATNDVEAI